MLNRPIRFNIRHHCRRFLQRMGTLAVAAATAAAAQAVTTVKVMHLTRCRSHSIQ